MTILQRFLIWVKSGIDRADASSRARAHGRRKLYCAMCLEALHVNEMARGYCDRCWALDGTDEPVQGIRPFGMKGSGR